MSEVFAIGQDYFNREKTGAIPSRNGSGNIAVEDMQVHPISAPTTPDESSKRPMSIILEPTATPGEYDRQNFPGIYMCKTIGPEGGSISIQGAKLAIPAGALEVSTRIRLGVVSKPGGCPDLKGRQALLSSVVVCEPRNLVFDCPVNLEIQHSAHNKDDWELIMMKSSTSVFEGKNTVLIQCDLHAECDSSGCVPKREKMQRKLSRKDFEAERQSSRVHGNCLKWQKFLHNFA